MKKSITLSLLILGAFIGAGFSSGREIYVFFARFGWLAIPMAIVVGFLLYWVNMFFLNFPLPKRKSIIFKIFEIILLLSTFILSASMFAGCKEISFNLDSIVFILITIIICFIQCFVELKGLQIINYILMPCVFVSIIYLCCKSGFGITLNANFYQATYSALKYLGLNCILLSIFLMKIGGCYTKEEKHKACIIVSIVISFFIIIISLALMGANENVLNSSLPLVELANSNNKILGIILCIIIWFGLITTLLSGLYVVISNIKKEKTHYKILIVVLCYFTSFVGWDFLTNKVYSIVGSVSIGAICMILIEYFLDFRKSKSKIFIQKK